MTLEEKLLSEKIITKKPDGAKIERSSVKAGDEFLLMHKDIVTASLVLDEIGSILDCEMVNQDHFPLSTTPKNISGWWKRRAIPSHQQDVERIIDCDTPLSYMVKNLSLSLCDGYWICPLAASLDWKDVNFYTNDFEEEPDYEDQKDGIAFNPSATTQGELPKRWIIDENGIRCLVKGNHGNSSQQSLNEVFASEVHKRQGREHTTYYPVRNLPQELGGGLGCLSENFTNENLEFIPAYDVADVIRRPNDVSQYDHYINACVSLGLSEAYMRDNLDYMVLSDFILTNTDRHYLNFGILRDSNTLQAMCAAPYFDTGNSMGYNRYFPVGCSLENVPVTSICKTEWEMLRKVTDYNALDVSKLPVPEELSAWYNKANDPYSVVYFDEIKDLYARKIQILSDIQQGKLNPKSKHDWLAYHGREGSYSSMRRSKQVIIAEKSDSKLEL